MPGDVRDNVTPRLLLTGTIMTITEQDLIRALSVAPRARRSSIKSGMKNTIKPMYRVSGHASDLVSGMPVKMPGRATVLKRVNQASRALVASASASYEAALELSRALDQAELAAVPYRQLARHAVRLHTWEASQ
jgi:hypothetical protein